MKLVTDILFKHKELIKKKNILSGEPDADPFLIAVAKKKNYTLITEEKYSPNAHKIPNVWKLNTLLLKILCSSRVGNFND